MGMIDLILPPFIFGQAHELRLAGLSWSQRCSLKFFFKKDFSEVSETANRQADRKRIMRWGWGSRKGRKGIG
jgi:hypothetical protein